MAGWDYQLVTQEQVGDVRVGILIPHRDENDNRAWRVWFENKFLKPEGTCWFEQRGFSLTTNRTNLVRIALEKDLTHIFFLDDDVICPDNIIPTLLSANLPIACGVYMAKKRKEERGLAAWMKVTTPEGAEGYAPIGLEQPGRYMEVDVTGLGCSLIKTNLFRRVPEPWFTWEPPPEVSEDFYFFEKVAKYSRIWPEQNGKPIKPVIDMTMQCLHIGTFVLDCKGEFDTPHL